MTNTTISKKQLIADLKRVKQTLGKKQLTRRIYRRLGNFASSTAEEHFSTWTLAKRTAGVN
jgi:hypothetical protein